ncbi:hypothetical protein J7F03_20805 [Streptomyces sp. ISL-43]|uniref:phage tail protein n=1 Tax=Streptomyces sp. ISL-43 TaxID=2819183 RepID=UPI001BEB59D3|nr:hypothetical protein [Streptomyces sp. ISL-43]MBT2449484.1 hypothetical protein [Streptomyces sp. ISL-43]
MAMTIGELVAVVRADESDLVRGLARAQLSAEGFTVDAGGRLRGLAGRFITESAVMDRALQTVEGALEDVSTQTTETNAVVEVETRTMAMRFRALARAADDFSDSLGARLGRAVNGLRGININTERLGAMAGRIGGVAMAFGKFGAAVGTAVPLVASLVGLVAQIAPAAGLAVAGLFTMVLATQTLKIGMQGVGDAVKAAMNPSDPEAFAEAIKNLAPSAQAFAKEVRTLQPQIKALQQGVQEQLFYKFDKVLKDLGKYTLPVLHEKMEDAASSLNLMGRGVGNAVVGLSMSGTLGKALSGATNGLYNLAAVPSQIVVALTQVGAAAAPAFGRLTKAAGAGADRLSEQFTRAFENGSVERAIERAIVIVKQLGTVIGNIGSVIGSVFKAAETSGGGFMGTLLAITGALKTAFASPEVQGGLRAIFQTMATLAQTVGPLIVMALKAVAPVFTALGPPIQRIITLLGAALGPVIAALGPVLTMAAVAVGSLLDAVAPLLPVIGSLVAKLLPALTPLLALVANVFTALAPLVAQLAEILMSALEPILAALIPVIQPIVDALMVLVKAVLPIISAQVTAFAPLIAKLAGMFAQLLVALAPVIAQLILLVANILTKMTPILIPIIEAIAKLAGMFANELGRVINSVIIPALNAIVLLLKGDFSGAWDAAKTMVKGAVDFFVRLLVELPARAGAALASLAPVLWARIQEAGGRFNQGVRERRDEAIARIREIPGQAASALGDLGSVLWNAGARLIGGLIDGIRSKIGSIRSTLGGITNMLPDWKGPAAVDARILRPAGRLLMQGFQQGINDQTPALQQQLGGLTGALPGMALGGAGGGMAAGAGPTRIVVELAGPQEMRALIRGIVQKTGGTVETVFGTR